MSIDKMEGEAIECVDVVVKEIFHPDEIVGGDEFCRLLTRYFAVAVLLNMLDFDDNDSDIGWLYFIDELGESGFFDSDE